MEYFCDSTRHLICVPYSIEGLHQMAKELNIDKCWYHSGRFPHYDIPKRRIKEISKYCTIISSKELLTLIKFKI